jgi:phosphatidate cytidylyltransferase
MSLRQLTPEVAWTVGGIFGVLVVASAVVGLLRWRRSTSDFTELRQRVNTWWVMVAVFSLALAVGRGVSLVFFAFGSFLAFKEYLSMIPTRRADRRPLFWAYLAIPLQYLWVYLEWYRMFIIFIPVYCFLLVPVRMLSIGDTKGYLRATGTIHWGLMTTVFSMSHAAFLLVLREASEPEAMSGPGLVLFLVVLTQANDVAQYLWGKSIGGVKILPTVSPGKTWAGFLGGLVTTIALGCLLGPYLTPMSLGQSIVAGAIIGAGGFFGDVNLSALKRDLGMKDSGTLLPGHGGILDRLDSLTYTAPLFFHFVYYLFVWQTYGASGVIR